MWQRSRSWDWGNITLKSIHRRCSVRKIFPKYTGKHLCQGHKVSTLLKSKLWHRYFPVNFAKFLRTPLGTCLWTLLTGIFLGLGMGKSWTSADFNQVSSDKKPTSKYVTLYKWYKKKTTPTEYRFCNFNTHASGWHNKYLNQNLNYHQQLKYNINSKLQRIQFHSKRKKYSGGLRVNK